MDPTSDIDNAPVLKKRRNSMLYTPIDWEVPKAKTWREKAMFGFQHKNFQEHFPDFVRFV